jgi:hypothetical protein
MGDQFVIYKKRSVYTMDHVGGTYVMNIRRLYNEAGCMSQDCVVDLDGAHVVLGVSDLYIHSGQGITSLLTSKLRTWLFNNIDSQYYERSFLVKNIHKNEVWVCFPQAGSSSCDRALVWNYRDETFALREIPNVRAGGNGAIEESIGNSWDADTVTWANTTDAWNTGSLVPDEQRLVLASPTNTSVYLVDSSTKYDGTSISGLLERTGLSFGIPESMKLCSRVYPMLKGDGSVVNISIGASNDVYGPYNWTPAQAFTIGTDFKTDLFAAGRYFGYRVTSTAASEWRMEGIGLDIKQTGKY